MKMAQRLAGILAQDDPAAIEFDLQHTALRQAQRIAHRLWQGHLTALPHDDVHGDAPMKSKYA